MIMAQKNLKESYDIDVKNGAFYTGGQVQWSENSEIILCQASDVINVLDVASGRIKSSLGVPDDETSDTVLTFTANESCLTVVSAHRSGLIKLWNVLDGTLVKTWKSIHRAPICELALDSSQILASGAADGIVRLWDLPNHACTHALRGCQGVISVVKFYETLNGKRVFASGDDLKIRCWNSKKGTLKLELAGHFSKVTGIDLNVAENVLVSCARDKVFLVWDLKDGTCMRTVPVYETLESIFILPKNVSIFGMAKMEPGLNVVVAGDKGVLRVFNGSTGREVFAQTDSVVKAAEDGGLSIVKVLPNTSSNKCVVITADHNIIIHSLRNFKCEKQFVGFADEILDVALVGPDDSYLAVATNSADIKVYNMADQGCQLLRGHSDFILTLSKSPVDPCLLLSAGKDCSVTLWKLDEAKGSFNAVAVGKRHTAAVNSVCFACTSADTFLSASLDTTLKVWRREGEDTVTVLHTEVAHSKDINCVTVAPNDKIVATASQDKTIKMWSYPELNLLGVLSGHRRGVWCVRFSPVDQILLSSSADCTIKLWSVSEMICLKTFEGHESSVLKAEFISRGMQVVSCSGDGLLKLWTIKNSECIATLDGHEGKIWALDVSKNEEKLVTGGSDSLLLVWRDTTEEKKNAVWEEREKMLLQEQKLANLIKSDRLLDALALALDLDRPLKVFNIIKDVIDKDETDSLKNTLEQLSQERKEKLLKCTSAWNCNAKNSEIAQLVISVLLDQLATGTLQIANLSGFIQDTLPYTERHFKRLTQTLQNLQILQYTLQRINPALTAL